MNRIDILVEGYAKIMDIGWIASGTTTLITTDSGLKIITDPGVNRQLLLRSLKNRKLTVHDINFVFITHHHLDHSMLVGIFPNARVIDVEAIDWQNIAIDSPKSIPGTDIAIIATPGHESTHGILTVPTEKGIVTVAGDNFWWTTDEKQEVNIEKHDDFAEDMKALKQSRKELLRLSDWIIPGHGKMFRVTKSMKGE